MKPAQAPMAIMPSTPRFRWPTFSLRISPTVPKSSGVPAPTAATRNLMNRSMAHWPPFGCFLRKAKP